MHKPGMIIQQVAAGDGALDTNGTIETGQSTSNVAWGEDEQTLFITGRSSVYRLRLTTGPAQY
jgi:gluconolactonase